MIFASMQVEKLLLPLLWQLVLIILAARIAGVLFRKIGQPEVVGEITAGLLLGPSLLGWVAPDTFQMIFRPTLEGFPEGTLHWVFVGISQVGLILLLFIVGMEFEFSHLLSLGGSTALISLAGILLPFGLGIGLSFLVFELVSNKPDTQENFWSFSLFLGTAMSITALPILGRMMVEWKVSHTRLAVVTITAAAFVTSGFHISSTLLMIFYTLLFGAFMIFAVRPIAIRLLNNFIVDGEISVTGLAVTLSLLFLSAIGTNLIGIFGIFGAFIFGAVLCDQVAFRKAIQAKLKDFVTAFFLPIFFAYTGLRTNIGSLDSLQLWLIAGGIIGASIIGKVAGCGLAAYFSGFSVREASCIGVLMNTRALMELIVINLGKDFGIISDSVFCMLVMMALVTTFMTTPILKTMVAGTEFEPILKH
ncbi:MAG: sodium:proton antiporter [Planctomycetaceae bacterium]|nr:MAG: sodium:proton antiporter [Planctomycetaceae bacterium]